MNFPFSRRHMTSPSVLKEDIPELEPDSDGSVSAWSASCENESANGAVPLNAPNTGKRTVVSFSTVVIREYNTILGDNPSVSIGCPLSLGWEYASEFVAALDDYEGTKPEARHPSELRLTSSEREVRLKSFGFSRLEILEGTRVAKVTRQQRMKTIETLQLAKFQELIEKANRKIFRAGRKRKEKELLKRSASLNCGVLNSQKPALKKDERVRRLLSVQNIPR